MKKSLRTGLFSAAILCCASSVCASPEDFVLATTDEVEANIITKIESEQGSIIFIDEAVGDERFVGLVATGSISVSGLLDQNATPLEVYVFFGGKLDDAPDRLVDDHYGKVDRDPINYRNLPDWGLASEKNLYAFRPASLDASLCDDLGADFSNGYGERPLYVIQPGYSVPPSEQFLWGVGNGVYDYQAAWDTFRNDLAVIDSPVAFLRTLSPTKVEGGIGSSLSWTHHGYRRDIAVCVNSWRLEEDFYDQQADLYDAGQPSEIPWDAYGLTPVDNRSDGDLMFGLCYSDETANDPLHNDIHFRVRMKQLEVGDQWWFPPNQVQTLTFDLQWIGQGIRYYSTNYSRPLAYSVEVYDLSGNQDSKLCRATHIVYSLTNSHWQANHKQ